MQFGAPQLHRPHIEPGAAQCAPRAGRIQGTKTEEKGQECPEEVTDLKDGSDTQRTEASRGGEGGKLETGSAPQPS